MLLKILYLLFLFLSFSYSDLRVGGIGLRYPIIMLILFVIIAEGRVYFDKVWRVYALFIAVFGVSCIAHGFIDEFSNVLFMQYFISFVGWLSTVAVLKKDPSFVKYIVYLILAIGGLDVLVTISQFTFNADWYSPIQEFFHFSNLEDFNAQSDLGGNNSEVNDSTLNGMFPNGVYNGYYLLFCSVLSMFLLLKTRKIISFILPLFFLVGAFCCQQRGPFFITLLVVLLLSLSAFNKMKRIGKISIIAGIGILAVFGFSIMNYSEAMELRYSTRGFEDELRSSIYAATIDYIKEHPFTANFYELVAAKGKAPHNLFLNAFVYGGILSFMLIMWLLYYQAKQVWRLIKNRLETINPYYYVFAFAWIAFTLNSMVHNRSIVTGDFMIWVIWGVLSAIIIQNKAVTAK